MSATPEQIAELCERLRSHAANAPVISRQSLDMDAAASLIRAQSERERVLVEALEAIRDAHIPDQPMADDIDEAEYARKHHLALRLVAKAALISARAALKAAP